MGSSLPEARLLLSVPEACQALGIGRTAFYSLLVNEGGLELVKIGRRSLVRTADLEGLVESLPVVKGKTRRRFGEALSTSALPATRGRER